MTEKQVTNYMVVCNNGEQCKGQCSHSEIHVIHHTFCISECKVNPNGGHCIPYEGEKAIDSQGESQMIFVGVCPKCEQQVDLIYDEVNVLTYECKACGETVKIVIEYIKYSRYKIQDGE